MYAGLVTAAQDGLDADKAEKMKLAAAQTAAKAAADAAKKASDDAAAAVAAQEANQAADQASYDAAVAAAQDAMAASTAAQAASDAAAAATTSADAEAQRDAAQAAQDDAAAALADAVMYAGMVQTAQNALDDAAKEAQALADAKSAAMTAATAARMAATAARTAADEVEALEPGSAAATKAASAARDAEDAALLAETASSSAQAATTSADAKAHQDDAEGHQASAEAAQAIADGELMMAQTRKTDADNLAAAQKAAGEAATAARTAADEAEADADAIEALLGAGATQTMEARSAQAAANTAATAAEAARDAADEAAATVVWDENVEDDPDTSANEAVTNYVEVTITGAGGELLSETQNIDANDDGDFVDAGDTKSNAMVIDGLPGFQHGQAVDASLTKARNSATITTNDDRHVIVFTNKVQDTAPVTAQAAVDAKSHTNLTENLNNHAVTKVGATSGTTIPGVTFFEGTSTDDERQAFTGTLTCPSGTTCSLTTDTDGGVTAISGYQFSGSRGASPAVAESTGVNNDYLVFGVWMEEEDANSNNVPQIGAFASGPTVFSPGQHTTDSADDSWAALVGTATYNGAATGLYTKGKSKEKSINYFQGDAKLTANFDKLDTGETTDDELGTITGTISNIMAGGVATGDVIKRPWPSRPPSVACNDPSSTRRCFLGARASSPPGPEARNGGIRTRTGSTGSTPTRASAPAYNGRARRRYCPRRDRGSIRVEGATHRATCRRGAMKRYELLSIIGSIVAMGIALGTVMIMSNANLRTEVRADIADVRTEMQTLRAEVNTEMQALRAEVSTEMQTLRTEVNTEMQTLRTEVRTDIADVRTDIRALEHRLAAVEQRQARTEGLLEGLRDAITARRGEPPPARKEST